MKRLPFNVCLIFMIACGALLMAACGGGGGSSDNNGNNIGPPPATTLQFDDAGAARLVGVAMFGQALGSATGSTDFIPFQTSASESPGPSGLMQVILDQAREIAYADSDGYQANGSASGSEECLNGGTLSGSISWDGPNTVNSCSDMANLSGSMAMSNCEIDFGTVVNGTIAMSVSGSSCNPTAMSMSFSNISISDTSSDISFSSQSLTLSISEISYASNAQYITHSRGVVHGDVSGSMGIETYDAAFHQLTQVLDTSDNFNFTMNISGYLRGDCLGGEWASITTVQDIAFNDVDNCPTAGELLISGAGDVTVIFNDDNMGGVQVGGTHYDSCDAADTTCPAPL